jgi:transposase
MRSNPVGFHTKLTDEVAKHIIDNVGGNYVVGQVARMTKIPKETLRRWLKRGEEEATANNSTVFSQLWVEFEHKRGIEIQEMLADIKARKTNWQASWELLKSIAKEDFGVEAVEYKELLELFNTLSEAFKRFTENPLQGAVQNGREMDIERNQEAGSTP